jgi:hypothetical protein
MTEEKTEVRVGRFAPDGTFLGELVRFAAEEAGSYTDYSPARSNDDRGITYTLYRTPAGMFRVYVEHWSRWQAEGSFSELEPNDPDAATPYTEAEARNAFPELLAAAGMPNTRDLD